MYRKGQMLGDARSIYILTRRQGYPADLYDVSTVINDKTGAQTITRNKHSVKRLVRLPEKSLEKVVRFTAKTTSPFTYKLTDAMFLVRKQDLPAGYTPKLQGYIIQGGRRWNIMEVRDYPLTGAFVLGCRHIPGENLGQIIDARFKDVLQLVDEVENG